MRCDECEHARLLINNTKLKSTSINKVLTSDSKVQSPIEASNSAPAHKE